jgi:hypothetical protein
MFVTARGSFAIWLDSSGSLRRQSIHYVFNGFNSVAFIRDDELYVFSNDCLYVYDDNGIYEVLTNGTRVLYGANEAVYNSIPRGAKRFGRDEYVFVTNGNPREVRYIRFTDSGWLMHSERADDCEQCCHDGERIWRWGYTNGIGRLALDLDSSDLKYRLIAPEGAIKYSFHDARHCMLLLSHVPTFSGTNILSVFDGRTGNIVWSSGKIAAEYIYSAIFASDNVIIIFIESTMEVICINMADNTEYILA